MRLGTRDGAFFISIVVRQCPTRRRVALYFCLQSLATFTVTIALPGLDGAGTVVEVGKDVRGVVPGQRIAYHQDLHRNGSFASHTAVNQKTLLRVPDILPLSLAAALPCPLMTAWQAIEKIPRMPEADVLITGAGGMVGRFLVQPAVQRNYRVKAMASARHHKTLRQLASTKVFGLNGATTDVHGPEDVRAGHSGEVKQV